METGTGMALLVRVVELKSFRAAADSFGVSPSAVSKQISALEDRLGARLLNRTTRKLGLTEVGLAYYEQSARILAEIEEAERAVGAAQTVPRGLLRICVPLAFGRLLVAPLLPEFLKTYPQVRVHVVSYDREVDLISEGFDVGIFATRLRDSSMIARKLSRNHRVVCATPGYWAENGVPVTPDDLLNHNCLINPLYSSQRTWTFNTPDAHFVVPVSGNLEFDNPIAIREATLKGLGVALLPHYVVRDQLPRGELKEVLRDYTSEDPEVYLFYPSARHLTSKIRVFVDFMVEKFRDVD